MSFADDRLWGGPSLTLSFELGFVDDDSDRSASLDAFWCSPAVSGPWPSRQQIGGNQTRSKGQLGQAAYGFLHDAPESCIAFAAYLIRERPRTKRILERLLAPWRKPEIVFHGEYEEGSDWLTVDVPLPILEQRFKVDLSWTVHSNPWLGDICALFAQVGDHVHARAPFIGAVMGEEVSGCWRRPTPGRLKEASQGYPPCAVMTAEVIEERGGFLLSPELCDELAPRTMLVRLQSGLLYVPPCPTAPLFGA